VHRARTQVADLRCVAITPDKTAPANLPGGPQIAWHARPKPQQLAAIYSACDVWLFASRYQGAGAEILQAMACRTPVVATATGAAAELVGRGGAGALVRPDDAQDMAKQIVTILRHPETVWRRLSDAAYATAQSHSWQASTDLLERILSMIYRKGGPVNDLPYTSAAPPAVVAPSRSARPLAP
jgi:glycosyltransferase involved in cell wall biosynthesis